MWGLPLALLLSMQKPLPYRAGLVLTPLVPFLFFLVAYRIHRGSHRSALVLAGVCFLVLSFFTYAALVGLSEQLAGTAFEVVRAPALHLSVPAALASAVLTWLHVAVARSNRPTPAG